MEASIKAYLLDPDITVRDPVHGNIELSELEKNVVDHELFQRLREINQLGFLVFIFPGSNHTRFEHSLGVYHLAKRLYLQILENQQKLFNHYQDHPLFLSSVNICRELQKAEYYSAFRLAALLHDLGHGPYSHASEPFLKNMDGTRFITELPLNPKLKHYFEKKIENNKKPSHEWMSLYLAYALLSDIPGLSEKNIDFCLSVIDRDYLNGLALTEIESACLNLLYQLLSNDIDCDRMDYLMRDGHHLGVGYGNFDIDRLLSNLCFIEREGKLQIALMDRALPVYEDYLIGRYQMYQQIYAHKTNISMEYMLETIRENIAYNYPVTKNDFLGFTDHSFFHSLERWMSNSLTQKPALCADLLGLLKQKKRPWKLLAKLNTENEIQAKQYQLIKNYINSSPHKERFIIRELKKRLSKQQRQGEKPTIAVLKKDRLSGKLEPGLLTDHSPLASTLNRTEDLVWVFVDPNLRDAVKTELRKIIS